MKFKTKICFAASALALTVQSAVFANPPYKPDLVNGGNRWTITAYFDNSTVHAQAATQGICFYPDGVSGTHQRYRWVSDTYPDWNGIATQEGDQVFMHGDFQWPYGEKKDGGHDSMEWEIVTVSRKNEGAGHWREWVEDGGFGNTIGFANAKLVRVGKCEYETAEEAFKAGYNLELPKDEDGNVLYNPVGLSPDKLQ
ncbi:MAG: hypothetical protein PVF13_00945 [Chromatiales bacterium]|jgi:hypothetical protein